MVNFGQSTIKECNFNNVSILCYENYTCDFLHYNNKNITNSEAEKEFKTCSKQRIEDEKKYTSLKYLIGSIVVVLILALVTFILIEKKKFKKLQKNEFRSGSIYIRLNKGSNNDDINNNNNTSTENNNNNNNNNTSTEINNENIEILKNKKFIYVADSNNHNYDKKLDKIHIFNKISNNDKSQDDANLKLIKKIKKDVNLPNLPEKDAYNHNDDKKIDKIQNSSQFNYNLDQEELNLKFMKKLKNEGFPEKDASI